MFNERNQCFKISDKNQSEQGLERVFNLGFTNGQNVDRIQGSYKKTRGKIASLFLLTTS